MNNEILIDGKGGILGRIASYAAKQSLLGKEIKIVNCDEILITGNREVILKKYHSLKAKGGASLKGPKIHKSPEKIMKRTIRGMLSHRQTRGREALKRIFCYNEIPAECENQEMLSLKREIKTKTIKLSELSKLL